MIIVYVAVRPAIGRMICQSRRPAELLHIGPISFNQSSYPDCCPSRTRWVITTVAPCSVSLKESRSFVKGFSPYCTKPASPLNMKITGSSGAVCSWIYVSYPLNSMLLSGGRELPVPFFDFPLLPLAKLSNASISVSVSSNAIPGG